MLTHTCWANIMNWINHNKFIYLTELYYLIESFLFFFGVGTSNATGNLLKQIPLKHYF